MIDQAERQRLKLRYALMRRSTKSGWCYGVKTPARPREHLWISIERRLTDLDISSGTMMVFHKLSDTAHVLAGSGILVEPPTLENGVSASDYVYT